MTFTLHESTYRTTEVCVSSLIPNNPNGVNFCQSPLCLHWRWTVSSSIDSNSVSLFPNVWQKLLLLHMLLPFRNCLFQRVLHQQFPQVLMLSPDPTMTQFWLTEPKISVYVDYLFENSSASFLLWHINSEQIFNQAIILSINNVAVKTVTDNYCHSICISWKCWKVIHN